MSVSWQDAAAFCNWLSAQAGLTPAYEKRGDRLAAVVPVTNGFRLPTEAEWEWVARSAGGGGLRKYPWGESLPVPAGAGNFADRRAQPVVPQVLVDLDDGFVVSAPVGSFAPNSLGFFDMGGNVAEWTARPLHCPAACERGRGRPGRHRRGLGIRPARLELEALVGHGAAALLPRLWQWQTQ